jgi:membrane-anchored protein YejM (alkaline phosphatase superfamily)
VKLELRDWFILAHVNIAGIVGTTYLFLNRTDSNYLAWCGLVATIVGTYHWLVFRDSKIPDATGE